VRYPIAMIAGAFALGGTMLLAGCGGVPPALTSPAFLTKDADPAPKETPDPLETLNRGVFEGNQAFNHAIVYPLAKAYREGVPETVRERVDDFTTNLSEPMVFANNVLQLRMDAAATTLSRFITNSTLGLAGLFDVAATGDLKHQTGDFGQTLYVWGVRDTAYLVLPVLGPSTVRDGIGLGIGLLAPSGVISLARAELAETLGQVNTVDTVSRPVAGLGKVEMLQELEASSLDFYALLRSVSDQKRQSELQQALAESLLSGPSGQTIPPQGRPAQSMQPATAATAPPRHEAGVIIGEPTISN
jgi:phospholipid-binding lipoprotein MlaA